jgi:hypothetical protein
MARRLEALPVYADMGGALLIRPTGEVLTCVGYSETNISLESKPHWRRSHFSCRRGQLRQGLRVLCWQ